MIHNFVATSIVFSFGNKTRMCSREALTPARPEAGLALAWATQTPLFFWSGHETDQTLIYIRRSVTHSASPSEFATRKLQHESIQSQSEFIACMVLLVRMRKTLPGGFGTYFLTFVARDGPLEWVRPMPKAPELSLIHI